MISKKHFLYVITSILVLIILIFHYLPAYVEKSRNRVLTNSSIEIPNNVKLFHQKLFIADLHSDSLLWNRNLTKKSNYGHVDLPRLIEGNVGLQVFSVVTKTPKILICSPIQVRQTI